MSRLFKQTLVLLAILFGGIAFLTSFYSSWNLYDNMAKEYQNRGTAIAKGIAAAGNSVLDTQNPEVIQAFFNQYFETRGVVYIIIRDKDGAIKYHTFLNRIPVELSAFDSSLGASIQKRKVRELGSVFDIVEPIHQNVGGSVQIGMDEESLTQLAMKSFFSQQLVVFIVFILTISVAYHMVKRISSPLQILGDYADDLSHSDFNEALPAQSKIKTISQTSSDEVGELAGTFVQLENKLISYIRNLRETTAIKEKIESELNVARSIQMNMVPRHFPLFPHRLELNLYGIIEPAKAVGGDFYDFMLSDDKSTLSFSIGDVSGKGIPAALFMAISITLIKATASQVDDPATVVEIVNKKLCAENKNSLFVTIIFGVLDLKSGELKYTIGGHNPPYVLGENKMEYLTTKPGLPMGIDETTSYTTEYIQLDPGDTLFLYTDGVTECRNLAGDFFGENRLEHQLDVSKTENPSAICKWILHDLELFSRGAAQSDDVTMVGIRWHGPTTKTNDAT